MTPMTPIPTTPTRELDSSLSGIEGLFITGHGEPTAGGAQRDYTISHSLGAEKKQTLAVLRFQDQDPADGINGVTNEALLSIVIDRLESFQSGRFACDENETALGACRAALEALSSRSHDRQERGVAGTPVE